MGIFNLSGGDMVLAAIPFALTLIAAIYWYRALSSTKYGADIDEKAFVHPTDPDQNEPADRKWYRLLSAATYVVAFQVLLLVFPRFGWGGAILIVPFLLVFLLVTVWLLFPERLTRPTDDPDADEDDKSRRQKFDEFFWQSIPVKRWFVGGPKMMVIEAVRRGLALVLLILLLLFGAFAEDDSKGSSNQLDGSTSNGAPQATVADQAQPTQPPKATVSATPTASPSASHTPATSPTPTQTEEKKSDDCDAPSLASDNTASKLTAKYIEVCKDGGWRKWSDVHQDAGDKLDVVFKEWNSKDDYGYGRITFGDKGEALIRFKLSDI